MLKYDKILVFDFETTGLNPHLSEIIEIGAILLKKTGLDYEVEKELNLLIKQPTLLPAKIVEITNITDDLLEKEGVVKPIAFEHFYELYSPNTLLVAYNIQFDIKFLIKFFKDFLGNNFEINNDLLDVMAVYKDFHQFPHRLESALEVYPVGVANSHRAKDDALATYLVLKKMVEELPSKFNLQEPFQLQKYINVIGQNPKYKVPYYERINYCKYIDHYPNKQIIYNLK